MSRFATQLILGLLLLLIPGLLFAQDGTITGTISDEQTGDPLPGATVQISEIGAGVATDSDGEYTLDVEPGSYVLSVSFVGYAQTEREIEVAADETIVEDFELLPGAVELDEVAITALGGERQRDQLGSSQASVSGDALSESGETGVIDGLSAQASGLNITSTGGDPGSGGQILIRGQRSIQGDNQPLIVVDGVPISNENFGDGVGGVQQQSRLNDLNPSDIESVEVLKGASAAALWGSRAQGGVILVQTRGGGFNAETNVSFQSKVSAEVQNNSIDLQRSYGQGFSGFYGQGDGFSWGDRIADREGGEDEFVGDGVAVGQQTGREYGSIEGGSPGNPHGGKRSKETFDHSTNLFDPGLRTENSISVSGGGELTRYYLSGSYTSQDGILPGDSNYERTTMRLNAERQITDALSVTGIANYTRSASDRVQQGSNVSGLLLGGYRRAPDFNSEDYTVDFFPDGLDGAAQEDLQRAYRSPLGSTDPIYDNPLWTANRITNTALLDRIQGKVEAEYSAASWLTFTSRVGLDSYTDRRQEFFPVYNATVADGQSSEESISEHRVNVDFLGTATQDLTNEISGSLTAGVSFDHREFDNLGGSLNTFSNPIDHRSLGNAVSENVSAFTSQSVQRTVSAYAESDFDFYDQFFLTASGRVDQASTFGPEADNTFFYPSIQANWQFYQVLPENSILSFGALRGSAGQVGREPGPYQAFTNFSAGSFFDGFTGTTLQASGYGGGFERSANLGNPFIQPEKTTEYEGGIDLRFFEDRVSLSGTYYFDRSEDVIFSVDVAPSTGFTSRTDNAAIIENRGVELDLAIDWPEVGDFSWTTEARWWANQNEVVSLSGVSEVGLAGFVSATSSLIEGEEFGSFFGNRWLRDDNGNLELNDLGFPQQAPTQGIIGNPNPDWRANIGNTLRYGDISLDVLWDFKIGGDVWNGTRGALFFFGTHGDQAVETTVSAEEAENLRTFTGSTIAELEPTAGDITQNEDGSYTFRGEVRDFGGGDVALWQDYYWAGPGSGFTGPAEPNIEDGSFVRLREVSLAYTYAGDLLQGAGMSSVDFRVTGRNLLLFSPYSGVDPETNLTGPSNGQGLDYFNNPSTSTYQFSVRFNF